MFDHYIGLEWAQKNMVLARITRHSSGVKIVLSQDSNIATLKDCLRRFNGKKILTFEESTPAQWLYTELRECVDEIIVCDPYRNSLLKEGPKTDKIDASKLATLLKGGFLKPVFHTDSEFIFLHKLVSGYEDLVRQGVQLKNQRTAMMRAQGKHSSDRTVEETQAIFVLNNLDKRVELFEIQKNLYEKQFSQIIDSQPMLNHLTSIPGIGKIGAVKIAAIVVDAKRFSSKHHFLSYCGLVKHDRMSGGRSYGKRTPRHSRALKGVFKTGALSCLKGQQEEHKILKDYYEYLITKKNYPEYRARHSLARRIAVIALGVMKSGKDFDKKLMESKFKKLVSPVTVP